MRRHVHPRHENHERWLVSYADFVTLLFAFFVVMYAVSQNDKGRAKAVADSVRDALQNGRVSAAISGALSRQPGQRAPRAAKSQPAPAPPDLTEFSASVDHLRRALESEIQAGKLEVILSERGLVISLHESAFFKSGDDVVSPAMYDSIGKIAGTISGLLNPVRLEGHTDSLPIHTPRFRSNWELSAARSIAMMELLAGRFQIPRARFSIAGYAETAPVAENGTQEGRSRNRRVDIVILNQQLAGSEPPKKPSARP